MVSPFRVRALSAILSFHLLIRFVYDRNIVQIEMLTCKIDITSVNFIEIMCSSSVHSAPINTFSKHIINKHCCNSTLPV